MADTIGKKNPLRYRGYYYDGETGLYYLSSRYYDSGVGRWINADITDVLAATPMALTDKKLFAYCDNNPVIRADGNGEFWHVVIGAVVSGALTATGIPSGGVNGKKLQGIWANADNYIARSKSVKKVAMYTAKKTIITAISSTVISSICSNNAFRLARCFAK